MFTIQRLTLRCNLRKIQQISLSAFSSQCCRSYSSKSDDNYNKNTFFKNNSLLENPVLGVGLGVGIGLGFYLYSSGDNEAVLAASAVPPGTGGKFVDGLPTYTMSEVAKHATPNDRVWTTFKQGVYDVTDFIYKHPGGDALYMAAGGSLEDFWMIYPFHKDEDILAFMEDFRIGNLTEEEAAKNKPDFEDPYLTDPKRSPDIIIDSAKPLVCETPLPLLMKHGFVTPAEIVYVRNHFPVPKIEEKDLDSYKIKFGGIGITPTELSLNDIKTKFPKRTIMATLTCAGNRRGEMILSKGPRRYKGLLFGPGAMSGVKMAGARVYDVLTSLGLDPKDPRVKYIQFEGLDKEPNNVPYGSSVPVEKAMDPLGDVLLCYEMNGEPLLPDHGFPIRAYCPGYVGARSIKWLATVSATDKQHESFWQKIDYKYLGPGMNFENTTFAELEKFPPAYNYPINSAICEPLAGETVKSQNGKIHLKGYAFAGGGNKIIRVDVTANCGKNWYIANITHESDDQPPHNWAWSLWEIDIPIEATGKQVELWVKGVDQNGNTQSERFQNCYNYKGILANAYHRVRVNVK